MNPQPAQQYLRTRVLTATPEQLQMMLFDGALRFGEQARAGLEKKNFEVSFSMITRVQKIVTELSGNLKPELAPDLCAKLKALYDFCYRKLVEANTKHHVEALDEALSIIRYQRETWAILLEKNLKARMAAAASRIDLPAPSPSMQAMLFMRG